MPSASERSRPLDVPTDAKEAEILREFAALARSYPELPDNQAILRRPYIVRKNISGVGVKLLIGNATAQAWYDLPDNTLPDGIQHEHSVELEIIRNQRLVRRGATVFDVGAHQGYVSLCLAQWVGPRGRVYAFEPFPQNADLLRLNARLNGVNNIRVIQAAVGARAGSIRVTQCTQSAAYDASPSMEVPCVVLDDFAHLRPSFIKMDVEGFEAFVFRGAQRVLRSLPNLGIEIHHCYLPNHRSCVADVLALVDWSKYEAWFANRGAKEFRPWRPGVVIHDPLTTHIYARRRNRHAVLGSARRLMVYSGRLLRDLVTSRPRAAG